MRLRGRTFDRSLRRYPKHLSDLIPWLDFVAPGIVLNDDESLMATIALTGPDLRAQPPEVQGSAMLQVNNLLRQLDKGWSLHSETLRLTMPVPAAVTTWQHPVAQAIGEEHRQHLLREPLLESQHYVTIRYKPPSKTLARLESLLFASDEPIRPGAPSWSSFLLTFHTMVYHLAMLLRGIMVDVKVLDDTETWNYLYSALNKRRQTLVLPADCHYMAEQLDDDPDLFGGGGLRPRSHGRYLRTLTLSTYPGTSAALMLARLNDLDIEYSWALRWIPFDQHTAEKMLQKQQETHSFHRKSIVRLIADRVWGEDPGGVRPMADQNTEDVRAAQVELGTEEASFGTLTVTVTVWDEDWQVSERKIRAVASSISGLGFGCRIESTNAVGAFIGSLPGMVAPNPRKPTLNTMNVSHLMAVDGVWSGLTQNAHWQCEPLFIARTGKSNPFRFVPHFAEDAAAHVLLWGPSGNGKSALMALIRVMCQQVPDLQDLGFDFKGSSLTTTRCLHGTFDDLGKGDVSLQPFRYVDQPTELAYYHEWLIRWLKDLNVRFDQYGYRYLLQCLERLSKVEPSGRTLSGLLRVMAEMNVTTQSQGKLHHEDEREIKRIGHMRDRIRAALQPFQGSILDGDSDGLQFSRVHTFELETLFDTPMRARPIMRHINHRLDQRFDGRPTLLWYDELQALLDDEESVDSFNLRLRRLRDKNVMLMCASQNVEDILNHRLGLVFANNCPNKIFLPNAAALSAKNVALYQALDLTYPQCQLLATAIPRAQWLYKSELGTRLVEHRLDPIALAVCGRSGKRWHQAVEQVLAEVGPEEFPRVWIETMGVRDATHHDWAPAESLLAGV